MPRTVKPMTRPEEALLRRIGYQNSRNGLGYFLIAHERKLATGLMQRGLIENCRSPQGQPTTLKWVRVTTKGREYLDAH